MFSIPPNKRLKRDVPGDTQRVSQATHDIHLRPITRDIKHRNTVETYMIHNTCYSECLIPLEEMKNGWEDKTHLDLKKPKTSRDFCTGQKTNSLVWNPEAKEFYPTKKDTENSTKLTENPVDLALIAIPSQHLDCEYLSVQRETVQEKELNQVTDLGIHLPEAMEVKNS